MSTDDRGEFTEHQRTFDVFIKITKWAVVATAITVVALYFLINP